jgi:predicted phosphodiesterase
MKIALASDIHLEFGNISLENTENADVLILSGDICVANELNERDPYEIAGITNKSHLFHNFFQECSARFPHVIYVAGNHEHYHGDFAKTLPKLKSNLSYLKNLYVLDKEMKTIGDVTFIGGTLWTDMNNCDSLTLYHVRGMMNDYRTVDNSGRTVSRKVPIYKKDDKGEYLLDEKGFMIKSHDEHRNYPSKFSPEDSVEDHVKMKEFIRFTIEGQFDEKFVVVGHHSPSKVSTKPQYENDYLLNGAYSSDLSEFILDHPQIKLWTHGHTHHEFDYNIGSTRIVCNPRGYHKYEEQADNFKLKFLDV